MLYAHLAILAWGLAGHFLLAIGYVNRLHGLALPRRLFKMLELPVVALTVVAPAAALWLAMAWPPRVTLGEVAENAAPGPYRWQRVVLAYFVTTGSAASVFVAFWLRDRWRGRSQGTLSVQGYRIDIASLLGHRPAGDTLTRWLANFPGNEIFDLDVRIKELAVCDWPEALDGLTITHLSDLHYSGRIGVEYHEQVIDEANALESDVIAVTGDLFDDVECFAWTARTLARLRAPLGVFFVLGNHDRRLPDPDDVRRRLTSLGWTDLGGRTQVVTWRGRRVALGGNELPWFLPEPEWDEAESAPRIALLHTPDQFGWAVRRRVALALAGHTHGGQVRFPWIGPIVSPSLFGVRYAGGTFREGRSTMHVSRGVSGLEPLRWNSPPEVTQLVLRRDRGSDG